MVVNKTEQGEFVWDEKVNCVKKTPGKDEEREEIINKNKQGRIVSDDSNSVSVKIKKSPGKDEEREEIINKNKQGRIVSDDSNSQNNPSWGDH